MSISLRIIRKIPLREGASSYLLTPPARSFRASPTPRFPFSHWETRQPETQVLNESRYRRTSSRMRKKTGIASASASTRLPNNTYREYPIGATTGRWNSHRQNESNPRCESRTHFPRAYEAGATANESSLNAPIEIRKDRNEQRISKASEQGMITCKPIGGSPAKTPKANASPI